MVVCCREAAVVLVVSFYCHYPLLLVRDEHVCAAVRSVKPDHVPDKHVC